MGKLTADTHSDVEFGVTRALIGRFHSARCAACDWSGRDPVVVLTRLRVRHGTW
jgi:hypothetical protein